MGVLTFTEEHTSVVSPSRIFKASILDANNLIPTLLPQVIKSMEFIQGTGAPGSIKQISFAQGSNLSSLKYRIDELNEETYTYNYTVIEGDALTDKLEKITHEVKLEAAPGGGTVSKVTSTYYTKGDFTLKEEDVKAGKERVLGVYKVVEAYLLNNPDAYA
ncbi:Major strawberry allergen Fra a 1.07 [Sesamum alatum]|uniref:Major strawberry allergen Fra a 1.07 n=1 Tax=Sesamum alatum TaxID=300844 RepID=A0AAE2CZU7_9LAMI|nr:Major strawberry allergen Fra a 1.07 [Sesamum alatum]